MPQTELLLFGNNILDGANVNTRSNGGFENEGIARIRNGEMPFEADDIVVVLVENATDTLEVNGSSRIVGIRVYDNATDYFNETALYTYAPQNPGQYANIQSDVSGLGDQYLRFNANVLRSDDPGAPRINQLLLVAGQDLSGVANNGETLVIDRVSDIDYNGNSTIEGSTTEDGNGWFNTENNLYVTQGIVPPICYVRGTLIETPNGPRFIETLKEGDLVTTLDHGPQPIRWIGRRRLPGTGINAPVRIRAGALGNVRDLWVSANHRMLLRGAAAELLFGQAEVLVAAKHLVNDDSIRIVPRAEVEYIHFLCDDHQIVFAEACPSESLYPGPQTLRSTCDTARAEILRLFPELEATETTGALSRYALTRREAQVMRKAG
ncbi:Hint domain-containing protein [Thalassococcus profundi]|nr:Hint domain-containing protein [Thalassococcus profundi]